MDRARGPESTIQFRPEAEGRREACISFLVRASARQLGPAQLPWLGLPVQNGPTVVT